MVTIGHQEFLLFSIYRPVSIPCTLSNHLFAYAVVTIMKLPHHWCTNIISNVSVYSVLQPTHPLPTTTIPTSYHCSFAQGLKKQDTRACHVTSPADASVLSSSPEPPFLLTPSLLPAPALSRVLCHANERISFSERIIQHT